MSIYSPEEYAVMLRKAAGLLVRISKHRLVSDPSLISPGVQQILDTPARDIAHLLTPVEGELGEDDEFGFGPMLY